MHLGIALLAAVDAGGYVSIWKLLPIVVLLLLWARMLTWIDKDAEAAHLPREALNTGIFLTGIIAFLAFFFIPNFWIALSVLIVALLGSVAAYLIARQQKVGLGDLTKELASLTSGVGKSKKPKEAKAGQVQLIAKGGVLVEVPKSDDPDHRSWALQPALPPWQ